MTRRPGGRAGTHLTYRKVENRMRGYDLRDLDNLGQQD